MAKHWTAAQPRSNHLASADSFNLEYDQHKGVLNGGIDRRNLGKRTFDRDQIADNAFHKVVLQTPIILHDDWRTSYSMGAPGGALVDGLAYNNYVGGWKDVGEYTLNEMHEGMLFVEFTCWAWTYKEDTAYNPKAIAIRFLYNGQTVAEGTGWYQEFCDPYLCAQFPVSGADGTLTVQWKYSAPEVTYDSTTNDQMIFAGGTVLAIARWR